MRIGNMLALALLAAAPLRAQDRGAILVGELAQGLGVSARVLVIGAHPDDEDTALITWLARGHSVETAYLSLTRGDGGQNLIGNELGEALGVIRTEELLAARRLDGGRQYFARAYDFGFSKSAEETYRHWPHDSLLNDVVTVIRAFRPHVIVSVFSGTPRDGHGHHQVSGILAREGHDAAGDTVRFPTSRFGHAWTPLKFYRGARFAPAEATLSFDVGEYSPLRGRSYAELSGESRSQHKSQAFGSLQRKGVVLDYLRLEQSRLMMPGDPRSERSLFDGIDTSWARFATRVGSGARARLDSLPLAFAAVREALDLMAPDAVIIPGAKARALLMSLRREGADADLSRTVDVALARTDRLLAATSGLAIEAYAEREVFGVGDTVPVRVTIYNRGSTAIEILPPHVRRQSDEGAPQPMLTGAFTSLAPATSQQHTVTGRMTERSEPWWLRAPRAGDLFRPPVTGRADNARELPLGVATVIRVAGVVVPVSVPVEYRFADAVRGEIVRPVSAAPGVSVSLAQPAAYIPANRPVERPLRVSLRSAFTEARDVSVSLTLPAGLSADSITRRVSLPAGGAIEVDFLLRGRLAVGAHLLRARATVAGAAYDSGYVLVSYDHIRPQRMYRAAETMLRAVDVTIPPRTTVAYIPGVGDNVVEPLRQLGLTVTVVEPAALATTDLAKFSAIVVGPRAYEASEVLVAQNPRIQSFARAGGTVVVQYGQYEMMRPGMLPYPITIVRPADRVTIEEAAVTMLAPASPLLLYPNRIVGTDFTGWVQERTTYMPREFDAQWTPLLAMNDPGESTNRGALLVAPLGKGMYVYVTLALFRQLPAAVPGAARLIVNMIAATQRGGVAQ